MPIQPVVSPALRLPSGGGELAGPWRSGFWFGVPGQVRSKSNHRSSSASRSSGEWAAIRAYELAVAAAAREHRPVGWLTPGPGSSPLGRPQVVVVCVARARLDTGNLDKCVLDALEGVAFVNDAQVLVTTSARVQTGTDQGLLVALAQVDPQASLQVGAAAGARLLTSVLTLGQVDLPSAQAR